jgi:hypothetical protein
MTESNVNEHSVKVSKCSAENSKDSLAAAAPDLLAALENLVAAIEFVMWANDIKDEDDNSYSDAIYQAKMAIGKAKGWV